MTPTATALLGYLLWMTLILLSLGGFRGVLTLTGKRAANSFDPSGIDVSPFSGRLCRVHANCYESFPIVGGVMLFALATGATSVTDPLAYVVLGARVGQSVVHLASTSVPAVLLRFALFVVQIAIALLWLLQLVTA